MAVSGNPSRQGLFIMERHILRAALPLIHKEIAEFYGVVNNTSGGNTYYGNDCSGFVSMSWKLPKRYTTTSFESDAASDGGYVTSLERISNGQKIQGLLLGDALVTAGHIIMFENYLSDGSGIKAIEQTPNSAVRTEKYKWDRLASYRPIRRNKIDEGNYVFKTKWGNQSDLNGQFNYPLGIAVDLTGNIYVADEGNHRIQKFNSDGSFITKWGTMAVGISFAAFRMCRLINLGIYFLWNIVVFVLIQITMLKNLLTMAVLLQVGVLLVKIMESLIMRWE